MKTGVVGNYKNSTMLAITIEGEYCGFRLSVFLSLRLEAV